MFEIELNVDTDGPRSSLHPLVKCGCGLVLSVFVILENFLPLAFASKLVLMNLQNPALVQFPLGTWCLAAAFLLAIFGFGSYCILGIAGWLTDDRLAPRQKMRVLASISSLSLTIAIAAFLTGNFDTVALVVFVGLFLCPIIGGLVILLGQVLSTREGAKKSIERTTPGSSTKQKVFVRTGRGTA